MKKMDDLLMTILGVISGMAVGILIFCVLFKTVL